VVAIIIGIIVSYILKIVVKSLAKEIKEQDEETVKHFIQYQVINFIAFGVAEFFPIALWTAYKSPDDFLNMYNVLRKSIQHINTSIAISKFSIFQSNSRADLKNSRLSSKSI
jgi:xanthine/uracil permease